MNVAWWLERAVREWPDKVAVISPDGSEITYRELRQLSDRMGRFLRDDCEVRPDEVVVTLLPDDHRHMAVFYGAVKIGAAFSGLSRILNTDRLVHEVQEANARTLVTSVAMLDVAEELLERSDLQRIVVLDPSTAVPDGRDDVLAILETMDDQILRVHPRAPDRVAAINFTSGTTGVPKGVIFSHGTLTTSAQGSIFWNDISSHDVNIACISMFHSGGVHDCVKWVMAGATTVWAGGWDPDRVAGLIQTHRPTWIGFIVPTMFRALMALPQWNDLPLEGVSASVGGEPFSASMQEDLLARGMKPINAYGLTETMPVIALMPNIYYDEHVSVPAGSSGRPNEEFCDVRLLDPVSGHDVTEPGVQGEILVRGPVVTPGYLDPADNARSFDEDGWLHTHDLATIDGDGWYHVGGRTDEIINSGGEKLALTTVEEALFASPLVDDVACIGVEHARFGYSPAAVVVPAKELAAEEIRDELDRACIATIERWMRPRLYILVDAVPRTVPKQSKDVGALKARVAEIVVPDVPDPQVLDDRSTAGDSL